jgi:Flp pilus assembly protein TadB
MSLLDQEIDLMLVYGRHEEVKPNWKGATAEEVSEFLLQHVPAENVIVMLANDPPRDRVQIERAIKEIESALPKYLLRTFAVTAGLAAMVCWLIFLHFSVFVAVLGGVLIVSVPAVMIDMYRRKRSEVRELKERLAVFLSGDQP